MKEGTYRLGGALNCHHAIATLKIGDVVDVRSNGDPASLTFYVGDDAIGRITAKHEVSRRIVAGETVLHCSVNSFNQASEDRSASVNVRIVTGEDGEHFDMPPPRSYQVGLVGESYYQASVKNCSVGDSVLICHERGNQHDAKALVVRTAGGAILGHIARDSWLRTAIHDEGRGTSAKIESIYSGAILNVVLNVTLDWSVTATVDHVD